MQNMKYMKKKVVFFLLNFNEYRPQAQLEKKANKASGAYSNFKNAFMRRFSFTYLSFCSIYITGEKAERRVRGEMMVSVENQDHSVHEDIW